MFKMIDNQLSLNNLIYILGDKKSPIYNYMYKVT